MIVFKHKGDFGKTETFFKRVNFSSYLPIFERYGREGVTALASVTPKDSGETASSWNYKVRIRKTGVSITWANSHIVHGIPIAIILQYGHGTRNGGYVQGRDYINPIMQPLFDKITAEIWKEVTKS